MRMRVSFPKFEEISGFTATLVQANLGGDVVPLFSRLRVNREQTLIREEGMQKHVYYDIHSMNELQTRYQRLKKLVLALFIISRKLKY